MTIRSNLKEVFDECKKKGLNVELGESYCSSIKSSTPHSSGIGWVNAEAEDDDRIMEDIEGEGSAEVTWCFGPLEKINEIGNILLNAFTKKGYIVVWNISMGCRISAVIEEEDLPLSFLEGWANESDEEKESENDYEVEEEIEENVRISPEKEVVFSKEEEEGLIFDSDEDEEEDEEEDEDENNSPIIDLDSDDEDEDT
jgi:hypothetical protein